MGNWTYLYFLPALACFIWPVIIILRKKRVNSAQWLMCVTMMLLTLGFLSYMVWFRGKQHCIYIYDMIFMWSAAFSVPMFYLFICSLTNPHGVKLSDRHVFLPSIIYCGLLLGIAIALGDSGYSQYVEETKTVRTPLTEPGNTAKNMMIVVSHYGYPIFLSIEMVIVLIVGTIKAHRFHYRFNTYYANKVNQPKLSDLPLLITTLVAIPLTAVVTFVSYESPDKHKVLNIVLILIITVLQVMMGYYTSRLSYTSADLSRAQREDILRQEVERKKKITII